MTNLADSIDVTFNTETTAKVVNTISTALDARGAALPDEAIATLHDSELDGRKLLVREDREDGQKPQQAPQKK